MAKQIIILDRVSEPSDNSFRYALWATVPATRVAWYADANAVSAFTGADAGELAAIRAGQIVESVDTLYVPAGTGVAAIQALLIAKFNTFQAAISQRNPTVRYGTFWDGSAWTANGTA